MTTDMTLTLNTLQARDTSKPASKAVENQPVAPTRNTTSVSKAGAVEKAARSEKPVAALEPAPNRALPKDQLAGAVSQMQDFAQMINRELQFDVDEELGRTVVRVVDKESGDLIRQIPSDEILEMIKQMKALKESDLEKLEGTNRRQEPAGFLMKTQA